MAYEKQQWQDEILNEPNVHFDVIDENGNVIYHRVRIARQSTAAQEGTKATAARMNHIEDGIAAISADGAIATANLNDGAVTAAKLADQAANTVLANVGSSAGAPVPTVPDSLKTGTIATPVESIQKIAANIAYGEAWRRVNSLIGLFTDISDVSQAGLHNCFYRGKQVGTSTPTAAQFAAIGANTFDGLWLGDYWTIGGINFRILAFNYYLNCGDQGAAEYNLTTPHIVIGPDTSLYSAVMNSTNTTEGGYYNSAMKQSNLETAISIINSAFGSAHVMLHRNLFSNAVANGRPSNGSWYNSTIDLMNEVNVFGTHHFSSIADGMNIPYNYAVDKSIFPLFLARPDLQCNRQTFWLRDVVSSAYFALANSYGNCAYGAAVDSYGVRPAFCLKS